jgi:hypothetical protein
VSVVQTDSVGTFAARLAERDRAAFAGRHRELEVVSALCADINVLLLHGPSGIGKSALMRELSRRGADVGHRAVWVDGREVASDPDALDEALGEAWTNDRALVLIEGYDAMTGLERHLRGTLLSLPEGSRVVVSSRRRPDQGWFEGGWEAIAAAMPLGPLTAGESRAVLVNQGLGDDPRIDAIASWSGGWPLALRMAADAARANPLWLPGTQVREPASARVDAEAVRQALRLLHVPAALAESPLARGRGMRERADSVRALISDAAQHAFGATSDEQLLRQILVRGYLDPAPSHEQAAAELHVSRSTYFRRLRLAADRVAAYVTKDRPLVRAA